jgi:hypothetical protein
VLSDCPKRFLLVNFYLRVKNKIKINSWVMNNEENARNQGRGINSVLQTTKPLK